MADRRNPFTSIGFSEYRGPHFLSFNLKDRAIEHESNRQRVVASILIDLYLMAATGIIEEGQSLSLTGAKSQSLQGQSGNAAAHCAPRQVIIDGTTAQDVLAEKIPERAFALEALFGETDILPVNFNKADSRSERSGLTEGFRKACQVVVDAGLFKGGTDPGEVLTAVQLAFGLYRADAMAAFVASIGRLNQKLSRKTVTSKDKEQWMQQLAISEHYLDTNARMPGLKRGLSWDKAAGLIKIYGMI
jgi:hypothetical protein